MSRTYQPDDFINALENESLGEILPIEVPTIITITGFVRLDNGNMQFSPGLLCQNWITIPREIVKEVEYLGKRNCGNKQLDYAKLKLTVPLDDPIITAFAGITHALTTTVEPSLVPAGNLASNTRPSFGQAAFGSPLVPSTLAAGSQAFRSLDPMYAWGWNPVCATCIATNITLATAIVAAAAASGLVGGPLIAWLIAEYGLSAAAAGAVAGGISGAGLAAIMCQDAC